MGKLNSKGITIVALTITIIVLLIIASVTVYVGNDVIKQAQLQTINTNMMLIQVKVKTIAEQANFNKDTSGYKGTKINASTIQKIIDAGAIKSEEVDKFYLLSKSDLKEMGLEKINIENGYLVNYETEEVIYVKGFSNEGKTYYKLSDMKQLTIN